MFLEVIDASLQISRREQIFPWLQGSFQYLFPHEILVCGLDVAGTGNLQYEVFSSIRYFTEERAHQATLPKDGIIWRVMASWKQFKCPIQLGEGLGQGDYGHFVVPYDGEDQNLVSSELHNIVAHGMPGRDGAVASFFAFSRVSGIRDGEYAYILKLLVPYLHSVLLRTMEQAENVQSTPSASASKVTGREREILQWLNIGKTNTEIAKILDISPLTVKNHVQNILRKLKATNRIHAVAKANRMFGS